MLYVSALCVYVIVVSRHFFVMSAVYIIMFVDLKVHVMTAAMHCNVVCVLVIIQTCNYLHGTKFYCIIQDNIYITYF